MQIFSATLRTREKHKFRCLMKSSRFKGRVEPEEPTLTTGIDEIRKPRKRDFVKTRLKMKWSFVNAGTNVGTAEFLAIKNSRGDIFRDEQVVAPQFFFWNFILAPGESFLLSLSCSSFRKERLIKKFPLLARDDFITTLLISTADRPLSMRNRRESRFFLNFFKQKKCVFSRIVGINNSWF